MSVPTSCSAGYVLFYVGFFVLYVNIDHGLTFMQACFIYCIRTFHQLSINQSSLAVGYDRACLFNNLDVCNINIKRCSTCVAEWVLCKASVPIVTGSSLNRVAVLNQQNYQADHQLSSAHRSPIATVLLLNMLGLYLYTLVIGHKLCNRLSILNK